jgi:hypothetical protein
MLRWLAVMSGDVVRVSELAMRTTGWLQEALGNPDARANVNTIGAYGAYLKIVREKEYRRGGKLVAYRIDKGRVRRMLRLIEDDAEMGALCWTGRAIHTWVAEVTRRAASWGEGDWYVGWAAEARDRDRQDVVRRLMRLGVHHVFLRVHEYGRESARYVPAPPRVMLSLAWDEQVPWVVEGEGGFQRDRMREATIVPPWGVV